MSILLLASLVASGSAASSGHHRHPRHCERRREAAATTLPTASDFENSYQQFAELLAPVMLLSNGMNFEVSTLAPHTVP